VNFGRPEYTRAYPQNALGWVELALSYTIANDLHRAERAILVALQLAPNNRHVLRAASRFFLHKNDPIRAYDIVARSDAINDPWLVASELALAELIDRDTRFYKLGIGMLGQQMLPRQITELAGSLATKELIEGNKKKARRFFRESMADPNANALAQAEWATPNFGSNLFSLETLNAVEEAHEAAQTTIFVMASFLTFISNAMRGGRTNHIQFGLTNCRRLPQIYWRSTPRATRLPRKGLNSVLTRHVF
jgi:hypothetical protein